MTSSNHHTLSLERFEGPINFLLQLIRKKEVDISEVSIKEITDQLIQKINNSLISLNSGAEFIGTTATLLLIKSNSLLPKCNEKTTLCEEEFNLTILQHLIDYHCYKEIAQNLAEKEKKQNSQYNRGHNLSINQDKELGIEHLSLLDLSTIFQKVISKIPKTMKISKEKWTVSDKIKQIRYKIRKYIFFDFEEFLLFSTCKEELITSFLAILELMKLTEICVVKDSDRFIVNSTLQNFKNSNYAK